MKNLLYYNLDSKFVTDQTNAGGDGTNVVSVVDGVAWVNDEENTYYRYPISGSNLTSYTVTIHYKNGYGITLAPDDVITVEAYVGKKTSQFLVAKKITDYVAIENAATILVSGNTEYTFSYDDTIDPEKPLTFNIISSGTLYWKCDTSSASYTKTIKYKLNDGNWTSIRSNTGSSAPSISVNSGDIVQFKGSNGNYYSNGYSSYFSASTNTRFTAKGNIMSLIYEDEFVNQTTLYYSNTFRGLFRNCLGIVSTVGMVLPATTLTDYCYYSMFWNCTSLTTAPVLPATTLASNCYQQMFQGCTSLVNAPELPATTLGYSCYNYMFSGCISLTTAPELPATTLANYCYFYMFQGCTSLTTAPELPATTLAASCYYGMFDGCTALKKIICLATNISASNCTRDWVSGVASSGTFIKDANMTSWTTGTNGIPNNWTVENTN